MVDTGQEYYHFAYYIDNLEIITFIVAIICATPVFSKMLYIPFSKKVQRATVNIWLGVLFLLSASSIAASTYNPFIYFRF